jgi:hypothetical protein
VYPTFHTAEVVPFNKNDHSLFPSCKFTQPGAIITEDGIQEYYVEKIIDAHKHGCGMQYLVRWLRYGPEDDEWLPSSQLMDNTTLDDWLAESR